MPCSGDKTQLCGAGNRLNLYASNDTTKVRRDPYSPAQVGGYKFYNCVVSRVPLSIFSFSFFETKI